MAVVLPVLTILMLSIAQIGFVMNRRIMLTEAVGFAARSLALTRSNADPCLVAVTKLKAAANGLTLSSLNITIQVNGHTSATSNSPSCPGDGSMSAGSDAVVTATYPYSIAFYGFNLGAGNFTAQTSVRVE